DRSGPRGARGHLTEAGVGERAAAYRRERRGGPVAPGRGGLRPWAARSSLRALQHRALHNRALRSPRAHGAARSSGPLGSRARPRGVGGAARSRDRALPRRGADELRFALARRGAPRRRRLRDPGYEPDERRSLGRSPRGPDRRPRAAREPPPPRTVSGGGRPGPDPPRPRPRGGLPARDPQPRRARP